MAAVDLMLNLHFPLGWYPKVLSYTRFFPARDSKDGFAATRKPKGISLTLHKEGASAFRNNFLNTKKLYKLTWIEIKNLFGQQIMCWKPYFMGNDVLWPGSKHIHVMSVEKGLLHATKSREIPGTPIVGPPFPYYSHTTPIRKPYSNQMKLEENFWIFLSWSLISGAPKSITWIFKGMSRWPSKAMDD